LAAAIAADERLEPLEAGQVTLTWRRFKKQRAGFLALIVLVLMSVGFIFVPLFSPFDPTEANPVAAFSTAGSPDPLTGQMHILGTDVLGRDNFTRVFFGGRPSFFLAVLATLVTLVIGLVVGLAAGYFGGWIDATVMRVTDFMLALPLLPMFIFGSRILILSTDPVTLLEITMGGMTTIFFVFVVFGWMGITRLVRGSVLSLRTREFVEASRALGAGHRRIVFRHLLPNSLGPVLVAATFQVADFIIWEAILAYFLLGIVDPPTPSWGNMLANNVQYVSRVTNLNPFDDIRAYLFLLPNIMIFITVLCINYIGDALREVLDPRSVVV
jgi:peptide/nickel transport system permease protein